MAAPTIQKLTKAEWKMVGKIKLVDFWGDEPFVTTYKIQVPTEVDTYYFWLTWNPVPGRPKKDRTADALHRQITIHTRKAFANPKK